MMEWSGRGVGRSMVMLSFMFDYMVVSHSIFVSFFLLYQRFIRATVY
jgi:hypothetical protein